MIVGTQANEMKRRLLGRTGIDVSVIAMGTAQLRLVPKSQALATLTSGFRLGINLVHTSPDYEGADQLIGQAIRISGLAGQIRIVSQGWGTAEHLERQLDETCQRLGVDRIDLFGIASLRDRELLNEDVWGPSGMVARLHRLKEQNRISAVFCSTHGGPDHLRELLIKDAFDAIMLAWNPLGFHLLSYNPANLWSMCSSSQRPPHWEFEQMSAHRDIIEKFSSRGVGVLIMKALAGGLLVKGKAFPGRFPASKHIPEPSATNLLRNIAAIPSVTSIVVGTASPAEAEENARSGWYVPSRSSFDLMKHDLCSRCGACDSTCSKHLPVSWLFRAAYIHALGSETFETWDDVEYFRLHPEQTSACFSCREITCLCPSGLDIPRRLQELHAFMIAGLEEGWVRDSAREWPRKAIQILTREYRDGIFRLWIANCTDKSWARGAVASLYSGLQRLQTITLAEDVAPMERVHLAFNVQKYIKTENILLRIARKRWLRNDFIIAEEVIQESA